MRSESSRPYAFGNSCSASGPRTYVVCGLRTPGFKPDCATSRSRSRLARCARTALSVRCNSSANSLTVHSRARRSSRIFPRVLLNNRSRQPICFIQLNVMKVRSKSKKCLTNFRLALCPTITVVKRLGCLEGANDLGRHASSLSRPTSILLVAGQNIGRLEARRHSQVRRGESVLWRTRCLTSDELREEQQRVC